jgi:hypothetical protein
MTAAIKDRTREDLPSLTLSIFSGQLLPLAAYTTVLNQVRLALGELDHLVTPGRQPRVAWGIREAHTDNGVHIARLEPLAIPRRRAVWSVALAPTGFVDGVQLLNQAAEIPSPFNVGTVERVGKIAEQIDQGKLEYVRLSSTNGRRHETVVNRGTSDNVRNAVKTVRRSYGSVTGTLDVLSARGRSPGAQILQENTRTAVVVRPGERISHQQLRDAWEHRVRARGLLHRNAAGQVTKLDLDDLELLAPRGARDPRSILGLAPDATGELTTEEYLELIRG